jgi:hypothetical protein
MNYYEWNFWYTEVIFLFIGVHEEVFKNKFTMHKEKYRLWFSF